jgi:hypothetical protein
MLQPELAVMVQPNEPPSLVMTPNTTLLATAVVKLLPVKLPPLLPKLVILAAGGVPSCVAVRLLHSMAMKPLNVLVLALNWRVSDPLPVMEQVQNETVPPPPVSLLEPIWLNAPMVAVPALLESVTVPPVACATQTTMRLPLTTLALIACEPLLALNEAGALEPV